MTPKRAKRSGDSPLYSVLPTWKGNLFVFGLLIVVVLAYFYRQVQQAHQTFLDHVQLNSGIIAGVIERNARSAVLSQEVVEQIIQTFLGNTARFVDYLDGVEPFSGNELSAFADEAGLAGIRIVRDNETQTEGPPGWFPGDMIPCENKIPNFRHLPDDHLYCLAWSRVRTAGCIVVGVAAQQIEKLQQQISLSRLLDIMSDQSGISYVRLVTDADKTSQHGGQHKPTFPLSNNDRSLSRPEVKMIELPGKKVAETRSSLGTGQLVVGVDAERFFHRVQRLWKEFFVFSTILAGFGIFLSWLLFRFQKAHLNQVRNYEREIARQREDATLGRAAASITHEIGNPLNAISMGLQRLKIEAHPVSEEHRELIDTMLKAVNRTSGIIAGIRRYAKPLKTAKQAVRMDLLAEQILTLYRNQCDSQNIQVSFKATYNGSVIGDPPLLEEVMENLVKNAIEAQPDGGYLSINVDREGTEAVLSIENGGFRLSAEDPQKILEPYFTTKTRGTGLGLSIAKRIVDAHDGRMVLNTSDNDVLRIEVILPMGDAKKAVQETRYKGSTLGEN